MRYIRRWQFIYAVDQVHPGALATLLLSIPALAPLRRAGYFATHDGLLHLYRLMGLDQAIRAGQLYPRWFPDFGFGYGQPVLNFYGPLAYYLGEIFHMLGAGPVAAIKWAYAAAALAAGLAMYLFARRILDGRWLPATVAALAYMYAPYHMADLYVRGALAELLAMAFFPFILWSLTHLIADREPLHVIVTGVATAGLILTHSLSLTMFGPLMLLYVAVLLVLRWDPKLLTWSAGAIALAMMLSAFYWVPAIMESPSVGLSAGASAGYRDHLAPINQIIAKSFPYLYFPNQTTMAEHPVGLLQFLLALPAILLLRSMPGGDRGLLIRPVVGIMTFAMLAAIFMNTTPSLPLWKLVEPVLSYLQYPWRFQAITALATGFLAGASMLAFDPATWRPPLKRKLRTPGSIWIAAGFAIPFLYMESCGIFPFDRLPLRNDEVQLTRMWAEEREAGQIGTTWTGEYVPRWVREQRWAIGRSWLDAGGPDEDEANGPRAPAQVIIRSHDQAGMTLQVSDTQASTLILHQFYYPSMFARLGNERLPVYPYGTLGLAAVDLPAGEHALWIGQGPMLGRAIGWALFTLGLGIVAILLQRASRLYPHGFLAAAGILVFVGMLLARDWTAHRREDPIPIGAEFEGQAALLAYAADPLPARSGDALTISLYWMARQGFEDDLITFVHVATPDGTSLVTQSDQQPDGGFTPTTRWIAGEIVPDRHRVQLPPDIPPGRYPLWAGMYEPEPLRNLNITSSPNQVSDDRVLLGYLEVTGS